MVPKEMENRTHRRSHIALAQTCISPIARGTRGELGRIATEESVAALGDCIVRRAFEARVVAGLCKEEVETKLRPTVRTDETLARLAVESDARCQAHAGDWFARCGRDVAA